MLNLQRAFFLVSVTALMATGCKKDPEPELITVAASATPVAVPADSAAPGDAVASGEAPKPVPAPITHTTTTVTPSKGESIDACCSALSAVERSGRDAATKAKYRQAAAVCPGIAALVKSGKTQRGPALVQVKSALAGSTAPAECN